MRSILLFSVIAAIDIASTIAITTTHHDKPEAVTITTIKNSTTPSIESSSPQILLEANVTISPSERKKRLLPYQNFYFNQPFNRPHQAGVSSQQYKDYETVERPHKKPELEPVSFRPAETFYQSGQSFTPFLESNALPGPFRPMVNSNHYNPQKVQYILVDRPPVQESKDVNIKNQPEPDLSAIYEKLAQLKMRQQAMHPKVQYGYRLVPYQRYREKPQKLPEFRPNYEVPRYQIQPTKTTIETFTATNIDIPNPSEPTYEEPEPPRYHQIPTPLKDEVQLPIHPKYRENVRPFVHHQIALEVPQSSLPLSFSPNVVRKPGNNPKERPRTYILIQQGKTNPKQQTFVLRKPKPSTVVDESFVAEKFIPVVHPKIRYHSHRPAYAPQENQYPETYEDKFEPQYQVTPVPPAENYQVQVQPSYGDKVAPAKAANFPVVVTPVAPTLLNDDQNYYQYQTGPTTAAPIKVTQEILPQYQEHVNYKEEYQVTPNTPRLESSKSSSLADILKHLQESNALPQTLTPDNIDNSIKTLVKILNALKERQRQHKPIIVQDEYEYENEAGVDLGGDVIDTPDGGTPGKPGVDYPALSSIPKTTFTCKTQRYKGFFGDPDTNCQVWHYCDLNGGQASFLCPNGTIFSQVALTCDWWYNVKCASTAQLYVLNERLYKYIIPLSPKFPEDYSGPLVDKYLAMKFQEMEEKLKKQKKGKGNADSKETDESTENGDAAEEEEKEGEKSDSSKEESQVREETEKPTTDVSETSETTTSSDKS